MIVLTFQCNESTYYGAPFGWNIMLHLYLRILQAVRNECLVLKMFKKYQTYPKYRLLFRLFERVNCKAIYSVAQFPHYNYKVNEVSFMYKIALGPRP